MVLTSTSGGPTSTAIWSTMLLATAGSVASPASYRTPSGNSFSRSSLRSTPTTVNPAAASFCAVARPSSPPAPTTIATRPLIQPPPSQRRSRVPSRCSFPSRVDLGAGAEVEADRLEDGEGGAGGERGHVGRRQNAGVLGDDRRGGVRGDGVEVAVHRGPGVRPVLAEVGGGVDRGQRGVHALDDVGDVLLVQDEVVAGAEPAEMTADVVLP